MSFSLCGFVTFKLFLHKILKMRYILLVVILMQSVFGFSQEKFDVSSVEKFHR